MTKRLRDIVAVTVDDLDAVSASVEDGVAYLEGVVPYEEQRRSLVRLAERTDGISTVIACLSTERVPTHATRFSNPPEVPAAVLMHYHSLC